MKLGTREREKGSGKQIKANIHRSNEKGSDSLVVDFQKKIPKQKGIPHKKKGPNEPRYASSGKRQKRRSSPQLGEHLLQGRPPIVGK